MEPVGKGGWVAAVALAVAVSVAFAARADGTITSYAITTFGEPPKYPADFQHLDYVNPDAPKGGEISETWQGSFDTMNPYSDKGQPGYLATIMYESMMDTPADETGSMYCLLCETLEYPADKAWVTFALRPEARFSDRSPVTAADVKFSAELLGKEGLVSFQAILAKYVDRIDVIDPAHVRYTFKPDSPVRDRIQTVAGLPVMSKAWFDKTGARLDESRLDPGIGSGPYVLGSLKAGERIVYARDPDWWGKDLPFNRGRNNFDTIRIEYFADPTAAFEGFKAGAYTFREENSSKNWATAYDFPAVKNGTIVKTELPDGSKASNQAYILNLRRAKFQDVRVREAIGLMFNYEWSNATLFYGLYTRVKSFWENTALAATGKPSPEELALLEPLRDKLPAEVFDADAVLPPVSGDRQLDRKNLRKASALLDDAGWAVGSDGIRRNAKGEVLSVEIVEDNPLFTRVNNPFVENLRALGVDAKVTSVDSSEMEVRTRANRDDPSKGFNFDIVTSHLPTAYEPGSELIQYFGSKGADDVFNKMGLADPAVDALIDKVAEAQTKAEMSVAVSALDRVLRAMRFAIPQWYKPTHFVAYYDMYEHPANLPPYLLGERDFWWYNAEKAAALKASGALR